MNPGVAVDRTTVLPHSAARFAAASATSGAVARPEMTSTSRMAGTGLKKCSPTRRLGLVRSAASAVGDREEVLDARMASAATTRSSSANSARFTANSSMTASMTTAQPASSATDSTAVRSRASGSTLRRPLATCALTRARMPSTARAAAPPAASAISTRRPATAATWAIPAPMVPAPTMPTVHSTTGPSTTGPPTTGVLNHEAINYWAVHGALLPLFRTWWIVAHPRVAELSTILPNRVRRSRWGLQVVDTDRVAGQHGRGGVLVGHELGDGAGVGGDARDAGPVGAEDHPLGEPVPVLPRVVVAQPGRRQAGQLDPRPVVAQGEERGRVVPPAAPAVREHQGEEAEIAQHVVEDDRVAEGVGRAGER